MMLRETIADLRREAKAADIPWRWVCERKNELLEIEREKRWAEVNARQVGWWSYVGWNTGSSPFWRHGFQARFGVRLQNGADYTLIPGYDLITQSIRCHIPLYEEWSIDDIWNVLLSDYRPWPPREKFYADALDDILTAQSQPCEAVSCEDF